MIIRGKTEIPNFHVKFISYDGKFPNLCSGELVLEIDGQRCEFYYTNTEYESNGVYHAPSFWMSGGGLSDDYSGSYKREWKIYLDQIPDKFKKYAYEIDRVFNENVEYGCCGGCI